MPKDQLDLTRLRSYSPEWPQALRLTLAIAVQYASQRCVQRSEALYGHLYPSDKTKLDSEDMVHRDEDGNVQGFMQGWERTRQVRSDWDLVKSWKDFTEKFIVATCQHLGIAPETLPPGTLTLEDIRAASRGRLTEGQPVEQETEFELGSAYAPRDHEGTGQHADAHDLDNEAFTGQDEKHKGIQADKNAADLSLADEDEGKHDGVGRLGGVFDGLSDSIGIELVNELLLISLGMGQHRAEDGSTTLFEQEAIFGDTDVRKETESEPEKTHEPEASGNQEPANAWSSFRSGIANLKKNSKAIVGRASQESRKSHQTTKPSEPCHYDARARAIISIAITAMEVQSLEIWMAEKVMAQTIYFIVNESLTAVKKKGHDTPFEEASEGDSSARGSWMNSATKGFVSREQGKANWAKWAAMGAGATVGGVLIGVTGGLAAPLVAPALVGLTGISFLATTGGVVMMATLLGMSGAGLAGYRVQRRLRGIDHFEFHEIQSSSREAGVHIPSLHATVCCSGLFLKGEEQAQVFHRLFSQTPDDRDVYTVHAEEDTMQRAGEGLKGYVLDAALKSGGQRVGTEVLKHTALAGIAALSLPLTAWTAASAALDGLFVQAKSRAYRAGLVLADVLRDEVQGHRPVILVGTSLGCVTIMTALQQLAQDPETNAHLIDSVFLIGAPISCSPSALRRARSIVARRFVNAYSSRDMVCSIAAWLGSGISLEEARSGAMPSILGSRAALQIPGLENVNVSPLVSSHFSLNDEQVLRAVFEHIRILRD